MNCLSPHFKIHYQAYEQVRVYIILNKLYSSYFQQVIQYNYINPSLNMQTQTNGSSNEATHMTSRLNNIAQIYMLACLDSCN